MTTVVAAARPGLRQCRCAPPSAVVTTSSSETRIFDKAERAGKLEELRRRHDERKERLRALKEELKTADESQKAELEEKVAGLTRQIESLESTWDTIEQRLNEPA